MDMPTSKEIVVWLVAGGIAGTLVGMIAMRKKEGFGRIMNLAVGLIGALIGVFLFNIFPIDLGLGDFSVSAEDLVSALIGSVILLVAVWMLKKVFARKKKSAD